MSEILRYWINNQTGEVRMGYAATFAAQDPITWSELSKDEYLQREEAIKALKAPYVREKPTAMEGSAAMLNWEIEQLKAELAAANGDIQSLRERLEGSSEQRQKAEDGFDNALKSYNEVCEAVLAFGSGDVVAAEVANLWRALGILLDGMEYNERDRTVYARSAGLNQILWAEGGEADFLEHMMGRLQAYKRNRAEKRTAAETHAVTVTPDAKARLIAEEGLSEADFAEGNEK